VENVSYIVRTITWRDAADQRNIPHLLGSGADRDEVLAARQQGLCRFELTIDVRGARQPGALADRRDIEARLRAVRYELMREFDLEGSS
jgi:hypothetical protein